MAQGTLRLSARGDVHEVESHYDPNASNLNFYLAGNDGPAEEQTSLVSSENATPRRVRLRILTVPKEDIRKAEDVADDLVKPKEPDEEEC